MATDLEKLMAQMPNLGAEMPTLTGNANPLAAGMAMNAPQPQVPQPPVETFNAATMGAPNFDEPFIIPQAAQAFGDVPVNMPSNPLDPNPQISAPFQRAEQPVDPRGFMERMADATRSDPAPSVGTGKPSPFGGGTAMRSGAEGANTVFKDTIQSAIPLGLPGALPFEAAAPVADASPTQIAPAADVNAGQEQVTLSGTPTSGSGIGTSVVNDVNFLQEGLKQAQAPQPQGLTTAGGQPLAEFLAGGQQLDAQGRMIDPNVDRSFFEQQSAERNERALSEFGQARGPDSTDRAAGEMTTADARDLAALRDPRASASEKARAMKVAERLGRDPLTGAPVKTGQAGGKEPLTFDQQMKVRAQNLAEGKFEYQLSKDATEAFDAGVAATKDATTEEARAETAGKTMTSAIGNMNDAMSRMGGRSGEFFGSGFFGKAASFLPGTSAYDQVADTEFLQSNVALNTMAELKDLSPTGSTGFGALSEKELGVLTNKYANLNPFTSPELFQKNLQQLSKEFNNMLDNAWSKHSKQYDEASANAIYGNRGGGEPAPASTGTTVNYEGSGYSIVQ